MQNTPGHDEACSTPCYFVCRIQTKLGDKRPRTYICIKENNIGHMMNNASHLRLPLFLRNFVVSPPGSGVTLWSAMIETNRLVLLNREAPVVPTDSARTDRIRNALTAWLWGYRGRQRMSVSGARETAMHTSCGRCAQLTPGRQIRTCP